MALHGVLWYCFEKVELLCVTKQAGKSLGGYVGNECVKRNSL